MPTRPPEILELAQYLRANYLNEAGRRSAVSRAYYAAMHHAAAIFGRPTATTDHESIHKAVIRAATERSRAPGPVREEASRIASQLDFLRRRRARADYDLHMDVQRLECEDWVTRAQRLIGLCDQAKAKLDAHAAKVGVADSPDLPPTPGSPSPPRPALKRIK